MRDLFIDIETYSSIDLKKCGVYRYAESPDFHIQLLSYAFDDEEVQLVDLTTGCDLPEDLAGALLDPAVRKWAWNTGFERTCLAKQLGCPMPPEQWWDDMVLAAVCGLPMGLGEAGAALGFEEDKAKDAKGKALIRWFAKPCKPTKTRPDQTRHLPEDYPEKWADYCEYNKQDVVAQRNIHRVLERWTPSQVEHRAWVMDQGINDRGVRIDMTLARAAVDMDGRYKAELTEQAVAVSGLENPKSVAQIKEWLMEQEGIEVPSLDKRVVADVVAKLETDKAKQFMAIRSELAKSSTAKYDAMLRTACADDHTRGCFMFYGAGRTGRWAGRQIQYQNLSKNKMPDLDECRTMVRRGDYEGVSLLHGKVTSVLSELVRPTIIPEEGHRFIVCDYSAIEARVLSWIAWEEWRLDVFREGGDIYCASASQMFGVPVSKHGPNADLRQKGKVAELALGYGGGVNALIAFGADKMGMTEEAMVDTVDRWRAASPRVVQLWRALEKAAIRCVVKGTAQISEVGNVRFDMESGILWMTLPSGRRISYFGARYEESKWKRGRKCLSYMGNDQKSNKKWTRIETWGGKLTENLVQACARDCLRDAMLALTEAGFDIRMHIHDEVVITEPRDGRTLEEVADIMGKTLPWAEGLPLRGDGYYCDYYIKD